MTIGFDIREGYGEYIAVDESYENREPDLVNNPDHYLSPHGMEAIDVIEEFGLGFHLGNSVKYILRAGKKDSYIQDLEKAVWYLEREIERVNNA